MVNNLIGWLTFLIAATVYCLTIEPTASFWDCPEFIITGYKLEVGHPPGAPFFMLTANFFSQFASDPTTVAKMVNYMSALMSAACIMFLFWSITHLVRKLIITDNEHITTGQLTTIMGSGLVGALIYTFTDTFWFSAVEGEVYAYSSLFTAVIFWLILKWEEVADEPHSDRWLILIAYLTGLSISVHLLSLLCLPAIVLIYYFKKNPNATTKGGLLALLGSMVLVGAVLYGIVPGVVKVGGWFELLFVNVLKMPFNTGLIVYVILLISTIIWGVYETYQEKNRKRMNIALLGTIALLGIPFYGHGISAVVIGILVLAALAAYLFLSANKERIRMSVRTMNTAMLCAMMIVVGYSSYTLIIIRSTANTPMDQNSPEDVFTLGDYLGREQYGKRPLFYGQTFASKVEYEPKGNYLVPKEIPQAAKYIRKEKTSENEKDSYVEVPGRIEYAYAQNMLFPRMYSSAHEAQYRAWVDIKGKDVPFEQHGEPTIVNIPTQWENLQFFLKYQLNFMYWRYFLWNFVGRQNDIQGNGEIEHGNWITGISFIDNLLIGNQELLPTELKENKGRNVYYGLPLILGIIGLLWQAYRNQKGIQQFWVVFFLFFMTGIAIVLYLNQTPMQVRERDYAYAGSFYAFAIWTGMGVAGIAEFLKKHLHQKELPAAVIASVLCILVPIQMAGQNWDDHDRSGRYVARDFGQNYLMSLQEEGNPIIYTNGDNDTFPLWYCQETEGIRTDARTCNLSYLQTDWYIDQMKRPAYDSPALPITWDRSEYIEGTNEIIYIRPEMKGKINQLYQQARESGNPAALANVQKEFGENPYELKNILKHWVRSDKEELRFIPTDSMVITIDKEAVRRSGMLIPKALGDSIPDYMSISLKGKHALLKSELMMLEMLANTNWERPVYIAVTVGSENRLNMDKHLVQEGLASRFTPFDAKALGASIDTDKMFNNIMNKFKFGGVDKEGVYIDENAMRMCYTHRRLVAMLATELMKQGDTQRTAELLAYSEKMLPEFNIPYDWQNGAFDIAKIYYQLGNQEQGDKIMQALADKALEFLTWYLSLDEHLLAISAREFAYHFTLMEDELQIMHKYSPEVYQHYAPKLEEVYKIYSLTIKNLT